MDRQHFRRALVELQRRAANPHDYYGYAYLVSEQLAGVFTLGELLHVAERLPERGRCFSGSLPVGRFADLPSDTDSGISPEMVALVAAALEGRLLALLPPAIGASNSSPDETLGESALYARTTVRQYVARTLRAIGLDGPRRTVPPRRENAAGTTKHEQDLQRRRDAERLRKRRQRAAARSRG